ncbi:MAG: hypothetical protein V9H69_25045 [Anaerolineae bacterium]
MAHYRALISVWDKTGLIDLARGLHAAGVAVDRQRRHGRGPAPGWPARVGYQRPHRLPGDPGRPGQDAAPGGAWRHSGPGHRRASWPSWPAMAWPPSTW